MMSLKGDEIVDSFFTNCRKYSKGERKVYYAFQEISGEFINPRFGMWEFMKEEEVNELFNKSNDIIKQILVEKVNGSFQNIVPKNLFISLMYSVIKFCKLSEFDTKPTGITLSIFYLTHTYFTGHLNLQPEKVYNYFKKFIFCHSLPLPPDCFKILSSHESKIIIEYFNKIYLRNLPLIRMLALPNFGLILNYRIPEMEAVFPGHEEKDKKEKKKK